ncbi:MAG: glutathione S-transferase family protein [Burkholderiaceae bacterium]
MALTLIVGNKNYSSWSLRAWLAMKMAGVAFDEIRIALDQPDTKANILKRSPSGRVPCLIDGDLTVWDSLAICEYVNETQACGRMWPARVASRAHARSVTAEMHSGFAAMRTHLSMDIRARHPDKGAAALARPDVAADVRRVQDIWLECLARSGGPFLFGAFSIADAFFAPVVTRFLTYGVAAPPALGNYGERVLELAPMQEWIAAAQAETEVLPSG